MKILNESQIRQKLKRLSLEILEKNTDASEIVFAGINNKGYAFAELLKKEIEQFSDLKISITRLKLNPALYHVLGGVPSPIDGIGPQDINLSSLLQRLNPSGDIKEVIMAINPTIEGETTTYYISKKLKDFGVKVSTIARGVAFGGELEYADEITLGRSIAARMPYHLTEE